MKLSIVTTLYRSAPYVEEFHRRASAAAAALTMDYEIVMVDDGSPDDSLARALAIANRDPRLKVVELSRNFGHHRAMMTGLEYAAGELVFLIDSDLEEEPEWLGRFAQRLEAEVADVVYGYQERRKGGWVERFGGAVHWWLIRQLSNYPIPDSLVTARLMRRAYVQSLVLHKEQKTAIGGLWALTGYRQIGVPIVKGHRGASSYSFSQRVTLTFEGITAFSEKPLMFVFALGVLIFVLASCSALYLTLRHLFGLTQQAGYASIIVSIWMLGGLSIASIGVVGLYTARIFVETKRRPYTIVRDVHQRR